MKSQEPQDGDTDEPGTVALPILYAGPTPAPTGDSTEIQLEKDESPSPPQAVKELSKARRIILGSVMFSATLLASATVNSTLMNIPSMARDFHSTALGVQWIASAYSLANACGLLFMGRLADLHGRKHLYLLGLALFIVFSIASTFVRNLIALTVLRALAGLGTALALPAAFGILGVTFISEPGRTIAFAMMGLGWPVGSGPGQIMSGLLADRGGRAWQYAFSVLAGLALYPLIVGYLVIPPDSPWTSSSRSKIENQAALDLRCPDTRHHAVEHSASGCSDRDKRIDWVGGGLITSGLALLGFSITQSGLIPKGWREPFIPILFTASVALIATFAWWEVRLSRTDFPPLVKPEILARKGYKVTWVLLMAFLAYTAIGGWVYLTSLWYQVYKGETALQNALHVLTAPIMGMVACFLVPLLAPRIRAPWLLMFGGMATSAACWLFAITPEGLTYWACEFLSNIVNPFGADFTVGIGSILMSNLVKPDEQSLAGAMFQTAIQLASTTGVCICSLVSTLVERQNASLISGLRAAFWSMAGVAWLMTLVVWITLRHVGLARDVGGTP